jgi:GntR family transcriptional repressor for pyruvate dehydrogenase complex
MFKSASSLKISDQIIDQVRQAIFEKHLTPGDKLPPEKELKDVFKVSKSTLREALHSLENMGFLTIRKGASGGAFVTEVDVRKAGESLSNFLHFQNLSLRDLSDVRILVESHIAEMAARKITEEKLLMLGKMMDDFAEQLKRNIPIKLYDNQIEFHRILGLAVGNPLLIFILDFISNILLDAKRVLKPRKEFYRKVFRAHKLIYKALLERDSRKAREAMIQHIQEEEEDLFALQKRKRVINFDLGSDSKRKSLSTRGWELNQNLKWR